MENTYKEAVEKLSELPGVELAKVIVDIYAELGALDEWNTRIITETLHRHHPGAGVVPRLHDISAWREIALDGGLYDPDKFGYVAPGDEGSLGGTQ